MTIVLHFFDGIKASLRCLGLVWEHKKLLVYPLLSLAFETLLTIGGQLVLDVLTSAQAGAIATPGDAAKYFEQMESYNTILSSITLVIGGIVNILCLGALISHARHALNNQAASIRASFKASLSRWHQLILWGVIATALLYGVSLGIAYLTSRFEMATWLAFPIQTLFSLLSTLVTAIIVLEHRSFTAGLSRAVKIIMDFFMYLFGGELLFVVVSTTLEWLMTMSLPLLAPTLVSVPWYGILIIGQIPSILMTYLFTAVALFVVMVAGKRKA